MRRLGAFGAVLGPFLGHFGAILGHFRVGSFLREPRIREGAGPFPSRTSPAPSLLIGWERPCCVLIGRGTAKGGKNGAFRRSGANERAELIGWKRGWK